MNSSPGGSQFFVAIPFAGLRSEEQWSTICRRLQTTLQSILNSEDPNFLVVIAGHERPSIPEIDDHRVTFISAGFPKPESPEGFRPDKGKKKNMALRRIREEGGGDVLIADADDHISNKLIGFVRAKNHTFGHVFSKGYVFDLSNGNLAPIPGSWRNDFDKVCGTCRVLRLAPDDIGSGRYASAVRVHSKTQEISAELGRPLNVIDWPAAVYVLGQRATISVDYNRTAEWQSKIKQRIAKSAIPVTSEIADEFNLSELIRDVET